jgi:carbonic anhydrase
MPNNTEISALDALDALRAGNRRFVSGEMTTNTRLSQAQRSEMAWEQKPFAIILGCSDSRVPAELVFDQGLGDLFVIRVAGNVVAPSQIGSVEFAAATFGIGLVVVLGHSRCGAVLATLRELQQPAKDQSDNLKSIVGRIQPSVEGLLSQNPDYDPQDLLRDAVRANVTSSVNQLQHGSEILEQLIENHGLTVVGAEYSLETGEVEFFDS